MDDKPLEILPWGRTVEQQAKLDAKREAGRKGMHGCLFMAFAVTLWIVYAFGVMIGKHS